MPTPRIRPDYTADERTQLVGWFDMQRSIVQWKCECLSDADAHRSVLPTSPLMTVAGVVSHLRWVEHSWFEVLLLDRPTDTDPQFGDVEDADMMVDDVPLAPTPRRVRPPVRDVDEIIAAHSLDELGSPGFHGRRRLGTVGGAPHDRGNRAARRPPGRGARAVDGEKGYY